MRNLVIGSRGSALSLRQATIVKNKLLKTHPELRITVSIITTKGDKNMNAIPLDTVGKGWFTKEIDKSLLDGKIDIAVHSLKDLPENLPDGLFLAAIPQREDAREVLVSKNNLPFNKLPRRAVIGTDSNRRKAQILHIRPDLRVKSIRGNVNTRLAKLAADDYDALILAAAGLIRLDLTEKITEFFSTEDFVPSPGQGALAVVVRANQKDILNLVKTITHKQTEAAVRAERSFSAAIGGGCKMPVGAYATCTRNMIMLCGMVASMNGKHIVKETVQGNSTKTVSIGEKLAEKILQKSAPWYTQEE